MVAGVLRTGVAPDTAFEPKQVSAKTGCAESGATPTTSNPSWRSGRARNHLLPARPVNLRRSLRAQRLAAGAAQAADKIAWGNAIEISPATAERFGLNTEIAWRGGEHGQALVDVVELQYRGRKLAAPVWITPGHADGCATVHLGYGRARGGVGAGVGFNAYAIRTSDAPWFARGLTIRKTGERQPVATTQLYTMQGASWRVRPRSTNSANILTSRERKTRRRINLYPEWPYNDYAWGMAIDLNACVGCNACVVACQSENNIPVVGKEQVMHGREMHWLRIDRYYKGGADLPEAFFQPVPCM